MSRSFLLLGLIPLLTFGCDPGPTVDDTDDSNGETTIDFGFMQGVGVGNLVFKDANGDGKFISADGDLGISGVNVQLFRSTDLRISEQDWQATAVGNNSEHTLQLAVVDGDGISRLSLRALHRRDTLHQDLKPDNILLCNDGTLKLIDLGSARVASLQESSPRDVLDRPGAADYAAPEYALGLARDTRADQFSLAVTIYELLTGQHPYGDSYDQAQTPAAFHQLRYVSACKYNPHLPLWFDAALRKACAINADNRYEALSELLMDLERPNPGLTPNQRLPWIERDPVKFWKWLALGALAGNLGWLIKAIAGITTTTP